LKGLLGDVNDRQMCGQAANGQEGVERTPIKGQRDPIGLPADVTGSGMFIAVVLVKVRYLSTSGRFQ
jgi:hypothetical protein